MEPEWNYKRKELTKMNIIEKAHELGKLILECPEMLEMKRAEEAQQNDDEAQELLKEFNLKRMNLIRDMQSEKITREEAAKMNTDAFNEMLEKSKVMKDYVEAKKSFDAVINELNGVINFYITGQEPGGCTHDCSSCGGCH